MARKKSVPAPETNTLSSPGQLILNLTAYQSTEEQRKAGVVDPADDIRIEILRASSFRNIPSREILFSRARAIAEIAIRAVGKYAEYSPYVMIQPPVFLVGMVEQCLREADLIPVYSFALYELAEADQNGKRKRIYHHAGWIEVTA